MAAWSTILPIFAIVISSLNNSSANEPIVVFPANVSPTFDVYEAELAIVFVSI